MILITKLLYKNQLLNYKVRRIYFKIKQNKYIKLSVLAKCIKDSSRNMI